MSSTFGRQLQGAAHRDSECVPTKNIAYGYHTYYSTDSTELKIVRESDITNMEYLELSFVDAVMDYLSEVKNLILTMSIGCKIVQQLPLSLLINLNKPIMSEGLMYINLCFDMFFGDIKLTAHQYDEISFKLSRNNCVFKYGITATVYNIGHEERKTLMYNSQEHVIQQLSILDVKVDANDVTQTNETFDITYLPFSKISKGFFIECDNDINHLNSIQLYFNGFYRFNLNRFLIMNKCKKINEHLLYIPFNYNQSFYKRTLASFEGAANLSRIDNIRLILTFDVAINNVKIYSLCANQFKLESGSGKLVYDSCLGFNTYDLSKKSLIHSKNPPAYYHGPLIKSIVNEDELNCPITHELIGLGEKYMSCYRCNKNFNEDSLQTWLIKNKTCPICRDKWTNFEIYINR